MEAPHPKLSGMVSSEKYLNLHPTLSSGRIKVYPHIRLPNNPWIFHLIHTKSIQMFRKLEAKRKYAYKKRNKREKESAVTGKLDQTPIQ